MAVNPPSDPAPEWRPCATQRTIRARAGMLAQVRGFFAARDVLEVETPLLCQAGSTDPALASFHCTYTGPAAARGAQRWLPTSPELHMKRLLAAGSGAIYQLCKVFRDGELGRLHNPEFTMLEWYRLDYDHHRLMDEVDELVRGVLAPYRTCGPTLRLTYAEAFRRFAGIDPHRADLADLQRRAVELDIHGPAAMESRNGWLDLLLTQVVEPGLRAHGLCLIYDYPADQAALARIRPGDPPVAERFELYLDGIELANGFHELADVDEQTRRFATERQRRLQAGGAGPPIDERMLAALRQGLPDCAGVALGMDRLLMLALQLQDVAQTLAFPWERA